MGRSKYNKKKKEKMTKAEKQEYNKYIEEEYKKDAIRFFNNNNYANQEIGGFLTIWQPKKDDDLLIEFNIFQPFMEIYEKDIDDVCKIIRKYYYCTGILKQEKLLICRSNFGRITTINNLETQQNNSEFDIHMSHIKLFGTHGENKLFDHINKHKTENKKRITEIEFFENEFKEVEKNEKITIKIPTVNTISEIEHVGTMSVYNVRTIDFKSVANYFEKHIEFLSIQKS